MDIPRVLIVSHEMKEYKFCKPMMLSWNVEVDFFENIFIVFNKIQEKHYDVIILDIFYSEMPEINIIARIKSIIPDIKIIIVSKDGNKKNIVKYLRYGVFDVLEKPIIPEFINHSIRKALDFNVIELRYRKSLEEIRRKNKEMAEMNETLSDLTRAVEKVQKITERKIVQQIRTCIMPIIENLQHDRALQVYESRFGRLAGYLEEIISGSVTNLEMHGGLSRREIQMALMIRDGMTNEEIATHLHISSETVKVHRRNIRKKLGIVGTKNKLNVYLHSLEGQPAARRYM
jgi:DNA-binding NarL/FixJ family response regulator